MPKIREIIQGHFDGKQIVKIEPENVVAKGATIAAAIKEGVAEL